MAVITADGMIGKVKKASNLTSTVQLLTGFDQYNRISAIAKRDEGKDVYGLIEKYDVENDSLVFKVIEDSKEELKKGEKIVSSNVLIVEIEEVVPDQYGLNISALVKPTAYISEFNSVIVVDRSAMTKNERDADEEASKSSADDEDDEVDEIIDSQEEEL